MSAGAATLLNIQRGELTVNGWSQVHTYQVFTTDGTDGPDVVVTASGLPTFYSALAYDPLARASRITPIKQEDATNHWHVEVEYSRETGSQLDRQNPPTLRPVKRSATIRWVEKSLDKDKDGQPILTSAKTPFNPPITVQVPHIVARFVRWESSFSYTTIKTYAGKVNSTTFGPFPAGQVLCTNIEASEEWEQNGDGNLQRYWQVTYEFEASEDWDKWKPFKILDADFWFIDPADSKRKPIFVDADGTYHGDPNDPNGATPVPSPVPLDGPSGDLGDVLQSSELPQDAHYLEFDIYDEVDFNALNLPVN